MNNQEAKFILTAYRPNGQDAGDPQFAAALEQAQTDPQLKSWFSASLEWDAKVGEALRSTSVPPNLRTSILTGHKVVKIPHARTRIWWMMAAASVMLLGLAAGMLIVRHLEKPTFAAFQQELSQVMASFDELQLKTSNLDEVQAYLASQGAPCDLIIPQTLENEPSLGCRVLDWRDRKVTLVCFRLGDPQGQVAHLLIMDAHTLRDAPEAQLTFDELEPYSTASWRQGDQIYLLATAAGGRSARSLVTPAF
jgi:hypothetical protein